MAFDAATHEIDLPALIASTRDPDGSISPRAFNAAREALGAEIARVTGVSLHIAEIAAGAYLNTPDDPMASFGDIWSGRNGWDQSKAKDALSEWMGSRAHRVAA